MAKVNRQFKDRLFRLIFGSEEYRENALSLYNAVNHTHYTDASKLIFTTLDNAVYLGMKNDLSFLLGSDMNLYEQQSTYNPNMGLRGLLYFSHVYSSYVEREALNPFIGHIDGFAGLTRAEAEVMDAEHRKAGFDPIEKAFSCDQAKCEAERCLQCDLRTTISKVKLWNEY